MPLDPAIGVIIGAIVGSLATSLGPLIAAIVARRDENRKQVRELAVRLALDHWNSIKSAELKYPWYLGQLVVEMTKAINAADRKQEPKKHPTDDTTTCSH